MHIKFSVVKGLKPKAHVTATFLRKTTSLGCWQLPLSRCYFESHSFKKVFTTFLPHQYLALGLWSCDCTVFESTTKGILSNLTFYGSCSPLSVQTQSTKTYECRQWHRPQRHTGHVSKRAMPTSSKRNFESLVMVLLSPLLLHPVHKDMRRTPSCKRHKTQSAKTCHALQCWTHLLKPRLWHKYIPRADWKTDACCWLSEQIASSWLQLPFVCQITLSTTV